MNSVASPSRAGATTHRAAQDRLIRRGSVYTLSLVLQMLSALVAVPLLTRMLTPAAYGQIATAVVVYAAVSILGAAGLPEAASRRWFSGPDGPAVARQLLFSLVLLALGLAAAIELSSLLWAPALSLRNPAIARVAVIGGAAGAVLLGVQALLRAADRPWAFLIVALLAAAGAQGLGVGATAVIGTPTSYMVGWTVGVAVATLVGLVMIGSWRAGPTPRTELRPALALGLPLVAHSIAVSMLVSIDRIVIAGVLGLAAAGRYAVAYAVGGIGVALITAINQAWMPLLLATREEDRWSVLQATSRTIHVLAAAAAATLALLAPLGLALAAPPSYDRAKLVPVAAIVAASALPYCTCGTYFQVVFLSGRTRVMALAAPAAVVVNVAVNLLLLRTVGLVGAAIATVAAYATLPLLVYLRARRIVRLPEAGRDAVLAWLAAAPLVAAGALLPGNLVGWMIRGLLLVVTLAAVALVSRRGSVSSQVAGVRV